MLKTLKENENKASTTIQKPDLNAAAHREWQREGKNDGLYADRHQDAGLKFWRIWTYPFYISANPQANSVCNITDLLVQPALNDCYSCDRDLRGLNYSKFLKVMFIHS